MIPHYDMLADPRMPADATYWTPGVETTSEGEAPGFFHDTELISTDIEEAAAIVEAEVEALEYLDARSCTPREFDDLASAIEYEMPDVPSDEAPDFFSTSRPWYGLNQLEVGVAGLVHALNAVGIITAASCRSHNQSHRPWSDYPVVVFAADRDQVAALQPLVKSTGCGFEIDLTDRPELIAIVASSVVEMMALAQAVLRSPTNFSIER